MRTEKTAVFVELCGLAGAGKSTTFSKLKFGNRNIQCGYRISILKDFPKIVYAFLCSLPIVARCGFSGLPWQRFKCIIYLKSIENKIKWSSKKGAETIVVDQGPIFLHAYCLTFGSDFTPKQCLQDWIYRSLDNWLKYFKGVFWLYLDDEILSARIMTRSQSHFLKDKPIEEHQKFIKGYRDVYSRILILFEQANIEVLRVNTGNKSIDEVVDVLRKSVINYQ